MCEGCALGEPVGTCRGHTDSACCSARSIRTEEHVRYTDVCINVSQKICVHHALLNRKAYALVYQCLVGETTFTRNLPRLPHAVDITAMFPCPTPCPSFLKENTKYRRWNSVATGLRRICNVPCRDMLLVSSKWAV